MPQESTITTKHGAVHVVQTSSPGTTQALTLLLVHGNSSSSQVWRHILQSKYLTTRYQVVAIDLPGHGLSSDAPDPQSSYSMRGYAECVVEILHQVGISCLVMLGWSLGGHICIEIQSMLQQDQSPKNISIKGIMLVGTPPSSGPKQVSLAFFKDPKSKVMVFSGKEALSDAEAAEYAHVATGPPQESWQRDSAIRTDGRARRMMFSAFASGQGVDQVEVIRGSSDTLYGVVNGAEEPFVNLDYLESLTWGSLWQGRCIRMAGLGHAPFWESPIEFELILRKFLGDCEFVSQAEIVNRS